MTPDLLTRDQLVALMVAERDAELNGRGQVRCLEWPDTVERQAKAVDFRGRDDIGEIVVEHTRIEGYEWQIADRAAVKKIFQNAGPEISDRKEAGYLRLLVPPGAMAAVSYKQRERVAEVLTDWTRSKIEEVSAMRSLGLERFVFGEHAYVAFKWALCQVLPFEVADLIGPHARVVQVITAHPENMEDLRLNRMRRAFEEKVPKLVAAAGGYAKSILVIEIGDAVSGSPALISRAMELASEGRQLPDAIYLLDTGRGAPYTMALYEEGVWAHVGESRFLWHNFSLERSSQLCLMSAQRSSAKQPK